MTRRKRAHRLPPVTTITVGVSLAMPVEGYCLRVCDEQFPIDADVARQFIKAAEGGGTVVLRRSDEEQG